MRSLFAWTTVWVGAFFLLATSGKAQDPDSKLLIRYNFQVNLSKFPQKTPQDAMKSLVKALGDEQFGYLVAQLVDPGYVDPKIALYRNAYPQGSEQGKTLLAFKRLLKETSDHFREDPVLLKELRLFAKEAEWDMGEDRATGTVKQLAGRHVFFRKYEDRWFLENRQTKEKEPPPK
jgi:hypothetical protein